MDVVYCEDTRTTKRLLDYLGIQAQSLRSLHAHNEEARVHEVVQNLDRGNSLAIVSDAGTPCISDPGSIAVSAAHDAGYPVIPVPGASAPIALLSAAGLPGHKHRFMGFLPKAGSQRSKSIAENLVPGEALVCFIPCRDLISFLQEVQALDPEITVVLGRELTKKFEEVLRLKVTDMLHALSERDQLKGEATVALFRETSKSQEESLEMTSRILDAAGTMVERGLSRKDAQRAIAQLTGISKRRALELVLQATEDPDGAG